MKNTWYRLTALLGEIKWRSRFLRCFHGGQGKTTVSGLAHWNPVSERGLSFLCGRFQWGKFPFLLTSLTRSTPRSILLVKCHPNTLFFSIQVYSKDLAFELLEFSIHKPISSPLKLFSIHTSYPANHSLRKRVLSKEKELRLSITNSVKEIFF